MKTFNLEPVDQYIKDNSLAIILVLILIVGSVLISVLPERLVLLLGVLLIGLPLAMLVVSKKTRNTAVVLMLVLLPLISILKAVTGSRFAPLTFDLGLLFACILHLGEGLLHGKLRLGKLDILLFFLWIIAFVGVFHPNVPGLQAGIEGFRKFIFMSLAFYLSRHLLQLRDFRLFSKAMILFSIPVTLYGIKQFFVMWPIDYRMIELATSNSSTYLMGGWIRPFATTSGPFQLGLYLMIVLLLILTILKGNIVSLPLRLIITALFILQIILLLMTRTKGNWIGLLLGVFALFIIQSRNPVRAAIRLSIFTLLGGAILLFVLSQTSGVVLSVLNDALFAITHPLQAPTFIFRIALWQETIIPAIQQNPFLGYGTSSAGEGLSNLYEGTSSLYFASHNLYIKVWIEMGLVGLFVFLWVVGASLLKGFRQLSCPIIVHRETTLLLQWGIAVVIAFLVGGIVIPTLDAYPPNYYFWLLLGMLSRAKTLDTQ